MYKIYTYIFFIIIILCSCEEDPSSPSSKFSINRYLLDFDSVAIGQSTKKILTIGNLTDETLSLNLSIENSEYFHLTGSDTVLLYPDNSVYIDIEFSPLDIGSFSGMLMINNERSIGLTGHGYSELVFHYDENDFKNLTVDVEKIISIEVENKWSKPIEIEEILLLPEIEDGLKLIGPPLGKIDPQQTKSIILGVHPKSFDNKAQSLLIKTDQTKNYLLEFEVTVMAQSELTLDSEFILSVPTIDGYDNEDIWNKAQEINLVFKSHESGKENHDAKLKSLHDKDYIYFFVKVKDMTKNDFGSAFMLLDDDPSKPENWTLIPDGQDGFAMMFPIPNLQNPPENDPDFKDLGCHNSCHTALNRNSYESGMYPSIGTTDIWFWKAASTNPFGMADDYVGISVPSGKKVGDDHPGVSNSYSLPNYKFSDSANSYPLFVAGGQNGGFLPNNYILEETAQVFNPFGINPATQENWKIYDIIPGWMIRNQSDPQSGRGNVEAVATYSYGWWNIEIRRLKDTQSQNNDDVNLKLFNQLPFSVAYFDNNVKFSELDYLNLNNQYKPEHYLPDQKVIMLNLK